jgi:ArsR family transcriptional regulator
MLNYMSPEARVETLAPVLRALGQPKRLAILDLLMEGVQCNCEISARLGLSLSLISHHVRVLEEAGLVRAERDAQDSRWIYYSVDAERVEALVGALAAFLDVRRIQPRQPSCGPGARCRDAEEPCRS